MKLLYFSLLLAFPLLSGCASPDEMKPQNALNTKSVQLAATEQESKGAKKQEEIAEPNKRIKNQDIDYQPHDTEYNIPDTRYRIPDTGYRIPDTGYKIPDTRYQIPDTKHSVPFAPQAPFGNWDMPYQEACEEASMIMAAKYFKKEPLDKKIMDEEILRLVKWEEKNGYPIDITAEQIAEILQDYFHLRASVSARVETNFIKQQLSEGNLIIAPAAGRVLPNPYFRQPGPLYHNLVIIGYDQDEFITNDPGTRRGEGFTYKYDDLLNAIHDWNGGARIFKDPRPEPDITAGAKKIIIIAGLID